MVEIEPVSLDTSTSGTPPTLFVSKANPSELWLLLNGAIGPLNSFPDHLTTTIYSYHHFPPSTLRLPVTPSRKTKIGSTLWWQMQVCEDFHQKRGDGVGGAEWRGYGVEGRKIRPVRSVDHCASCGEGRALGKLAIAVEKSWVKGTTKRKRAVELLEE